MKTKALILSLFLSLPLFVNLSANVWMENPDYIPANVYEEIPSRASPEVIVSNKNGETAWSINVDYDKQQFVFWSAKSGPLLVDLSQELSGLGFEIRGKPGVYPIHLDNNGNVFIRFVHKTPAGIDLTKYARSQAKIGIWNQEFGFRYLEVPELQSAGKIIISDEIIVIDGVFGNKFQHKVVVIENTITTQKNQEIPVEDKTYWKQCWPFTWIFKKQALN